MSYRVAGDWGTSRLRLYRIEDGAVADRIEGPGIGALDRPPGDVLRAALAPWRAAGAPDAVALCGMVGSRNGWVEVPYVDCPVDAAGWRHGGARLRFDDGVVTIAAGLAGTAPSGAPDVMRGEETQIFGAMALRPALAHGRHRIALPGTHGKWASVEDGRIVAFRTFFTGELFALLRHQSTLTRAAAPAGGESGAADEAEGFAHGLDRAREGLLLGALFEARSAQLRLARTADWALGYLSGLLIGREVAEAAGADQGIALIGDAALCARYARALAAFGPRADILDGDACVLAGLDLTETAA